MPKFVLVYGRRSTGPGRRPTPGPRQQRSAWEPAVRATAGSEVYGPPVGARAAVVYKQLAHTAEHLVGEPGIHGQMRERVAGNLDDCGIVAGRVVNSEPNRGFLLMNGAAP